MHPCLGHLNLFRQGCNGHFFFRLIPAYFWKKQPWTQNHKNAFLLTACRAGSWKRFTLFFLFCSISSSNAVKVWVWVWCINYSWKLSSASSFLRKLNWDPFARQASGKLVSEKSSHWYSTSFLQNYSLVCSFNVRILIWIII